MDEFNQKITEGKAPEYPCWEDLIGLKNIEAEIKEILTEPYLPKILAITA